jgi:hypothetical protein
VPAQLPTPAALAALAGDLERLLAALSDPSASPERLRRAWEACGGAARLERELAALCAGGGEPEARERLRPGLERLRRLNAVIRASAERQRGELEETLERAHAALLELRAMLPRSQDGGSCDVAG